MFNEQKALKLLKKIEDANYKYESRSAKIEGQSLTPSDRDIVKLVIEAELDGRSWPRNYESDEVTAVLEKIGL